MNPIAKTLNQHKKANQKIKSTTESVLSLYRRSRERLNDRLKQRVLSKGLVSGGQYLVDLIELLSKEYSQYEEAFIRETGEAIPYVAQSFYRDALNDLGKTVIGKIDLKRIEAARKEMWTHVAGMTQNMLKSDVGYLRNAVSSSKQNGDPMADPDMEFVIVGGDYYPISYRNDYLCQQQDVFTLDPEGNPEKINKILQDHLTAFANHWMKNIANQQNF